MTVAAPTDTPDVQEASAPIRRGQTEAI